MPAMPLRHIALLLLFAATALLDGCTLSRAQIRHADAVVAATAPTASTCDRTDHCARPSPLLDAARQALAASTPANPRHRVALLDASEPALVARLDLIRGARRSIDVQT